MPRTRSLAWSELKIGLMSVFAIIVATAFIFLLTGSNGFFWQRYSLKAVFPDIAGLKEGAPVRVAGVEVGSVTGVEFIGDRVEVLMEVLKENRPRITTTRTASSRPTSVTSASRRARRARLSALCFSGRLSVISAVASRRSTRRS